MRSVSKNTVAFFGALLAWFAVITQFVLMLINRITDVGETIIRFFSFFTILTNLLVALYFTAIFIKKSTNSLNAGTLTAITVYITIVGLVYQVVLREIWEPTGLQRFVDELLHSVIPTVVILFWWTYENKNKVLWKSIPSWLLYPLCYLIYILVRGNVSNFYPYPFVNVTSIGIKTVLTNSVFLLFFFIIMAIIFVGLGKWKMINK